MDDTDSSDGSSPPTPRKAPPGALLRAGNPGQESLHALGGLSQAAASAFVSSSSSSAIPPGHAQSHPPLPPAKGRSNSASTVSPLRPREPFTLTVVQQPAASPKRNLFSRATRKDSSGASNNAMQPTQNEPLTSPRSPPHVSSSLESSTSHTTLSSLLKGVHHHHLHHHHKPGKDTKDAGLALPLPPPLSYGASTGGGSRGRSLDIARDSSPISPSFFASTGRHAGAGGPASGAGVSSGGGGPGIAHDASDDLWPLLCSRVLPLFNGEGLRQPIEDINRLVSQQLRRYVERKEQRHVVEDLAELFETGIRSLDNGLTHLSDERLLARLIEIWSFFFAMILPYLEATFLPISIEFTSNPSPYLGNAGNLANLSINALALSSYRDVLIVPRAKRLEDMLMDHDVDAAVNWRGETMGRLMQCLAVLRGLHAADAGQAAIDRLHKACLARRAAVSNANTSGSAGHPITSLDRAATLRAAAGRRSRMQLGVSSDTTMMAANSIIGSHDHLPQESQSDARSTSGSSAPQTPTLAGYSSIPTSAYASGLGTAGGSIALGGFNFTGGSSAMALGTPSMRSPLRSPPVEEEDEEDNDRYPGDKGKFHSDYNAEHPVNARSTLQTVAETEMLPRPRYGIPASATGPSTRSTNLGNVF
ncbi:hypothetical protein PYCC9005_005731 [Savitreella phatthalungensis]